MTWQQRASRVNTRRGMNAIRFTAIAALLAGAVTGWSAAAAAASSGTSARPAAGARAALLAGDSPAGFLYGTDSATMTVSGSAVPYREPVIGGYYGGYIGMTGNWANWICGHKLVVWSATNSSKANANHAAGIGIGTGVYWFMGGPGVDPRYNGTASEAYAWGQRQAARTLSDIAKLHVTSPVVFMDVEIPGNAPNYTPASDNGWNTVYTSACSGVAKSHYIAPAVDRADFNGFWAYLTSHSSYKAGVYSAPDIWSSIFGTGAAASIPHTYEWTYESFTSSLTHHPAGWCLSGTSTCARFFGGQARSSSYALMWQWSGGGGARNGYGDFDQIDTNRMP